MMKLINNRVLVSILLGVATLSQGFFEDKAKEHRTFLECYNESDAQYKALVERQDLIKTIMLIKQDITIKRAMLTVGGVLTMIASGNYIMKDGTFAQGVPQDARTCFQGILKLVGAHLAEGFSGLLAVGSAVSMYQSVKIEITPETSLQELKALEQALIREKKNIDQGMMGTAGMATMAASAGYVLHALADKNLGLSSIPGMIGAVSVGAVGALYTGLAVLKQ